MALIGSGEYTSGLLPVDRYLLDNTEGAKTVALLPTAAGQEHDASKWIKMGEDHFRSLGADPIGLEVYNATHTADAKVLQGITDANLVYFSGGDPGYLLTTLKGSRLWEGILEHYKSGGSLAGSSAGAMAFGAWTFTNPYQAFEGARENARWEHGLGLVDYAILPHYDHMTVKMAGDLERLWEQTPAEVKIRWMGIDEETAVIIKDRDALVMGKGSVTLHRHGRTEHVKSGGRFTL